MKRKNNHKQEVRKKKSLGKILLYIFLVAFILGILVLGVVYKYVSDILAETPPIEVYDINVLLSQNSFIYDNQGNLIERVEDNGLRTVVSYDKIDDDIKKAIVAVEDKTFWEHHGFNYVRLAGAVIESFSSGKDPKGTSTITQQYARNMYLPETRFASGAAGYKRKVQEAYYAVELEKNLSKEDILSAYLNTIEFGNNTKGIQAATTRYFSKNADDIDYIEAAILAGIPQANTTYSPFKIVKTQDVEATDYVLGQDSDDRSIVFNESCLERYQIVLKVMLENGAITQEEYDYAKNFDIKQKLKPTSLQTSELSSYFTDMVKREVIRKFMERDGMSEEDARNLLYRGGLRIYSTMDSGMQKHIDGLFEGEPFTTVYDNPTSNAVRDFQTRYGLEITGVADANTIQKMVDVGMLRTGEINAIDYYIGVDSEDVLRLKQALQKAGLLYKENSSMPGMQAYRDANKNILKLDENLWEKTILGSSVMLNYYYNIINPENQLVISPDNYYTDDNGDIVFVAGKMFNFYFPEDEESEIELLIKNAYKCRENNVVVLYGGNQFYYQKVSIPEMYIYNGYSVRIPKEYKSRNANGEFVLSKDFISNNPDVITQAEDGTLYVNEEHYGMSRQGIIQPQAAITVIDYRTGHLLAVAGGRNVEGQMIYNRATNPRQPGSSIKPLGVYTPCLDNGFNPTSIIEDIPTYTPSGYRWPQNWDYIYHGSITLREAVEQSGNVAAVKFLRLIGEQKGIEYLQKFGISTLKLDGDVNDLNVSAIALGGMSHGVTNFDMTGAYGALANGGVRKDTITFTKISDKNGNVVFENKPKETFVVSEQVAWLMQDILYSTANGGFMNKLTAIRAGNVGIPVVGKTGTTSNKYDIWYCGYTPYYASSVWMGSDINLELSDGSLTAARYWTKANQIIHEGYADKGYKSGTDLGLIRVTVDAKSGMLPSALSYKDPSGKGVITDWFIPGNQPGKVDNNRVSVAICNESGKIASPFCPSQNRSIRVYRRRIEPVPARAAGIGISDSAEIIPSSFSSLVGNASGMIEGSEDIDYVEMAKLGLADPYCYIHTGEDRTDELTSDILSGVGTIANSGGGKIITESIIITRHYGEPVNVDAGSQIYESGVIVTTSGVSIYPWQIKSFERNNSGPTYNPNTNDDGSDGSGDGTDDSDPYDDLDDDDLGDDNSGTNDGGGSSDDSYPLDENDTDTP